MKLILILVRFDAYNGMYLVSCHTYVLGRKMTRITKAVNSPRNPFVDSVTHFIHFKLMYDYHFDELISLEYIYKGFQVFLLYFRGKSNRPSNFKRSEFCHKYLPLKGYSVLY